MHTSRELEKPLLFKSPLEDMLIDLRKRDEGRGRGGVHRETSM